MATNDRAQHFITCEKCQRPVEFTCIPCGIKLCGECSLKHMRTKSKRGHELREYSRSLTQQCDIHLNSTCDVYCKSCCVPVCSECVSTNEHKQHDLSSMSVISSFFEALMKEEIIELQTKVKGNFEQRIQDINSNVSMVSKHFVRVRQKLKLWGEKWHQEITSLEESLEKELKDAEDKALKILNEEKALMESKIQEISESIKKYEDIQASENPKLLVKFQSKLDQLSKIPTLRKPCVFKFMPAEIPSDLKNVFGNFKSFIWPVEFASLSKMRTSKEIMSVVNQQHGNLFNVHEDNVLHNDRVSLSQVRCLIQLHPKQNFLLKGEVFCEKVEQFTFIELKLKKMPDQFGQKAKSLTNGHICV
ncbi:E3 ubiquitin-protein ligase TRIM45-like [Saccostrea cucullata]|uniref:E3 ubiquitin-protein ligase TRIM45-like n=1 Tax=Saccostrea cuccullata TaxID=36930 RepID=UPI002ED62A9F